MSEPEAGRDLTPGEATDWIAELARRVIDLSLRVEMMERRQRGEACDRCGGNLHPGFVRAQHNVGLTALCRECERGHAE